MKPGIINIHGYTLRLLKCLLYTAGNKSVGKQNKKYGTCISEIHIRMPAVLTSIATSAMKRLKSWILGILMIFLYLHGLSQTDRPDTIYIHLDSAENMFLHQNLLLLAQQYNVSAQKALIMQARLYNNPSFSLEHGLYNPETKNYFNFGQNGETSASLSQLIILAGKRNKQIKIAEANATLSEYQFYDLLRTLKYSLRTDFYNIFYLQQSAKIYNEEITSLQKVADAFQKLEEKGNISEKEVVRIRAQLYNLQNEYNDLINQVNDVESEMRLLLQVQNVSIVPVPDSSAVARLNPAQYPLSTLVDSAYKQRTDLMIARANTDISRFNYSYQKSLATPDITLALSYDQQGSYIHNFNSIGLGIDIPIFNRNQGNIKSAKTMIDVNTITQKNTEASVAEQVYRALQKAFDADKLYKNIDPGFSSNFNRLMHEVLINYQRRNISLLDFLDFYDSYKQTTLQMNSIQYNRLSAFEALNFYTGTNFFSMIQSFL